MATKAAKKTHMYQEGEKKANVQSIEIIFQTFKESFLYFMLVVFFLT